MYPSWEVVYGTPTSDTSNRGDRKLVDDGDEVPAFIGDDVIYRCPSWLNTSFDIFNRGDRERMDDGHRNGC